MAPLKAHAKLRKSKGARQFSVMDRQLGINIVEEKDLMLYSGTMEETGPPLKTGHPKVGPHLNAGHRWEGHNLGTYIRTLRG
ncbi:hypothetical protein U1Q18_037597, partial [Sarracenia purpurea var. burkii]